MGPLQTQYNECAEDISERPESRFLSTPDLDQTFAVPTLGAGL